MTRLSAKQESFIRHMVESDELARRGFELLLTSPRIVEFFAPLREAGLFSPERNPEPVPAAEPGYFRVPYWSALDYLLEVAKHSGRDGDENLAELVMEVVRNVSSASEHERDGFSNYHTAHKFAEILGLVPPSVICREDLELIPRWLNSRFDDGSVARALDKGALESLLASEKSADWGKAAEIVRHCTAIRWLDESGTGRGRPVTVVNDHWLKKLLDRHVPDLAVKQGARMAGVFSDRLREVFDGDDRGSRSWLWRPAVEDHPQNHQSRGAENRLVEGLRDTMLHWVPHDSYNAIPYVGSMLKDEAQIIRRIAIYVINRQWAVLRGTTSPHIGPALLDDDLLHEVYGLLESQFSEFTREEKAAILDAIRQLPREEHDEDSEGRLRYKQRQWLSAVAGKGSAQADAWFARLNADVTLGPLSKHPSFRSYMESWSGFGPSPYPPQELLALAQAGTLIETLNSFTEGDSLRGPTTRSLVDALEEAAMASPQLFVDLIPKFLDAHRPYQYGMLSAFKGIWDSDRSAISDWTDAWQGVFSFMEEVLLNEPFWVEEVAEDGSVTPTRDWIPPLVSELLRAGTRDDSAAYPAELLDRGMGLLRELLERSDALSAVSEDPMTGAINSPKGKAIEALFSHALRACRLADREGGNHVESWGRMSSVFDGELSQCRNDNFEFSTLVGAYLGNFHYLNREWLQANMQRIFPTEFNINFACAVDGLAYAQFSRDVYLLLLEHEVFDRGLRQNLKGDNARQKLLERLAVLYLWGDETLDSPRMAHIFREKRVDDLVDMVHFFWGTNNEDLDAAVVARILDFWEHCVQWARDIPEAPPLLSALSRLTRYVTTVGPRETDLLIAVAPHVAFNHNDWEFVEELLRLVERSPAQVNAALGAMLEHHTPVYDFRDMLMQLLQALAAKGYRLDVMKHAERLREMPGMLELYTNLQNYPTT